MAYKRALTSALQRSLDDAKNSLARAMRMDVTAPTSEDHASLLIYPLASREDVKQMAFGCDADVGGLSSARLELDPEESKGRFFGTLSSELPRGAKIERSGYAGIRNKTRTTLFGCQTWDTTDHPFLRLRVRNRLAGPPSVQPGSSSTSSSSTLASSPLRSALSGGFNEDTPVSVRAAHALGLNLANRPGPKFFVNVQTDGPVTSDLFQHRLVLDESKGNAWQDVIIPLSDFVLTNSGQVSTARMRMMREAIRTVGISAILELPSVNFTEYGTAQGKEDPVETAGPPGALRRDDGASASTNTLSDSMVRQKAAAGGPSAAAGATTTARGSRRGASYNFDLGIESISAITEDALGVD